MRCASRPAAVALFLGLVLPSIASAQDVMQLDTMFRDSLLRKPEPQSEAGRFRQEQVVATRRHPKRHRQKVQVR
jgi:hypothetical protein